MKNKKLLLLFLLFQSIFLYSNNSRYFLDNFGIGISSSLSKGFLDRRELSTGVCLSFQIGKVYFDFFNAGESFLYEKPNAEAGKGIYLHVGPRGGRYYYNSSGNKVYVTGYSPTIYSSDDLFYSLDYDIFEVNFGYLIRHKNIGITPILGVHIRRVLMDTAIPIKHYKQWAIEYNNTSLEELYRINFDDISKSSLNLGCIVSFYTKDNYKFDFKITARSFGISIGLPFNLKY